MAERKRGGRAAKSEPVGRVPGMLMAQLLRRFMWFDGALQQSLDLSGFGGVRRLESMVMVHVHAGVSRPAELARLVGVTRQSMNTALRELEEKKLVRLEPDPQDGRCKRVVFAKEGEAMRREALSIVTALEARLATRLGEAQLEVLADVLSADWGDASPVQKTKVKSGKGRKAA